MPGGTSSPTRMENRLGTEPAITEPRDADDVSVTKENLAAVVVAASSESEALAESVIISLVFVAWVLSIAAFLHKWRHLRILPPRALSLKERPKNLETVTVVDHPADSVIYRSYPIHVASTLQARFNRIRRSFSIRLANLPLVIATAAQTPRPTTAISSPEGQDAESRGPEVMSTVPREETSNEAASLAEVTGSQLPEATASLPEVARSLPEVTLWLPEMTLSLPELNPSRPEVLVSVQNAFKSDTAVQNVPSKDPQKPSCQDGNAVQ